MERAAWVKEQLVPAMLARGSFDNWSKHRLETTKCHVVHKGGGGDHFTSTIFFINLELKFEHQTPKVYHMLLKISPEDPIYRKYIDADILFHNETLMYNEVIPSFKELLKKRQAVSLGQIFPKCYYAKCGAGDTDIVVLENMAPRGFRPSADKLSLDYDHCAIALSHLARYHAISYAMKKLEPSAFHAMVKKSRAQNYANSSPEDMTYFLKKTSYRGVRYVEARQELDQATLDRLKDRLEVAGQLFSDLMAPKEPLAVMCHGDFCRNNILFRYDSGKPCDAILFDFQNVKYGSPVIDLSLLMYLNMSSELRAQHWDDLFGEYHVALTGTLAEILGCSVEELLPDFGLEEFRKEFVGHCLYGYLICSFFLPQMLVEQKDQMDYSSFYLRTIREVAHQCCDLGGELATQKLADILKHVAAVGGI
ncbi:hypothetical protein B7P43_G05471 [Cryptotermes secundus]|uniref:CHK kinase-like domain-containing protein n=1 Tax=Cryptotermes secundus TaxID=105785 RepID=A0A2J7R1F9_9NEOP|nr:uncharacterized protein LOC111863981 [Cryptotermes secundus]PNF34666.1 hypothetical protein B7P43_G05471 [Cryptotermes secundus]PNF34667.1 hypothetical protein B7P43_G05471 [Cryptotermes secundus]